MRRLFAALALLSALGLTGCVAGGGSGGSDGGVPPVAPAPAEEAPPTEDSPATPPDDAADRQVVTTGSVRVVSDDPVAAAEQAAEIVADAGGRVDSRTERAPGDGRPGGATLLLRIPADRLDRVLDALRELGDPREVTLSRDDVSLVVRDLDARIDALAASVDRLLALLDEAADTGELVELETALAERQGELDSLRAQRAHLADQVALASITLELVAPAEAPPEQPGDFWSGLALGWNALTGFGAGLAVALGVLLPWLGLAALLAATVILAVRAARRRPPAA